MFSKFELDVNLDGYPGVSRVRGSNRFNSKLLKLHFADFSKTRLALMVWSKVQID